MSGLRTVACRPAPLRGWAGRTSSCAVCRNGRRAICMHGACWAFTRRSPSWVRHCSPRLGPRSTQPRLPRSSMPWPGSRSASWPRGWTIGRSRPRSCSTCCRWVRPPGTRRRRCRRMRWPSSSCWWRPMPGWSRPPLHCWCRPRPIRSRSARRMRARPAISCTSTIATGATSVAIVRCWARSRALSGPRPRDSPILRSRPGPGRSKD